MTDQVDDGVGVEETKPGTSLRRAPSAVAEPQERNLVLPAPTSGIVVGHVGIDSVGTSAEIVSVRSLAGSLDPLLFRLQLLTLGPGGEFFSRGLLPLCFKVPGSRLVAVLLRLAPRCIGRDCGSTPHDDDSTRHGGDGNDNDHDDDDNGHIHERTPHPDSRWSPALHALPGPERSGGARPRSFDANVATDCRMHEGLTA
jgi:hypothetical protein